MTEILGQEKALSYLALLARSHRVPGAFLFYGPDGVGKKLASLSFAKALNCLHPQEGHACNVCANCVAIDKGTYPDVTVIDFEYQARLEIKKEPSSKGYEEELEKEIAKQQHLSVSTVRNAAIRSQQKAIGSGGWKVLIVDQAQTMQGAAANALLKFIEEPPFQTVWILITSKRSGMLKTILSRCQPLAFAPLAEDIVAKIIEPEVDNASLAARYSGGSVSAALSAAGALTLLQNGNFGTPAGPIEVAGNLSRTLVTARQEAQSVLDVLTQALHRQWKQQPDGPKARRTQQLLKRLENYKRSISRNVSPALVLETALMGLDGIDLTI